MIVCESGKLAATTPSPSLKKAGELGYRREEKIREYMDRYGASGCLALDSSTSGRPALVGVAGDTRRGRRFSVSPLISVISHPIPALVRSNDISAAEWVRVK